MLGAMAALSHRRSVAALSHRRSVVRGLTGEGHR